MINLPVAKPNAKFFIGNEVAGGATNNQNLDFTTAKPFVAGTLEVYIDGVKKLWGLDFQEAVNLQGFTFLLNPNDVNRLNKPPTQTEEVTVKYIASAADSDCMLHV